MPLISCKICDKEFYAKPFWVRRGFGIYCSPDCQHKGRRNGKSVNCHICKKEVYKSQKNLNNSKSGKYFCSKSCQTKWRNEEFVGEKHANWRHGEYSYRSILTRNKVLAVCKLCGTIDKRILAVHHIDKNHSNNELKNLSWLCHNCHHLVHHYKNEEKKFMEALV